MCLKQPPAKLSLAANWATALNSERRRLYILTQPGTAWRRTLSSTSNEKPGAIGGNTRLQGWWVCAAALCGGRVVKCTVTLPSNQTRFKKFPRQIGKYRKAARNRSRRTAHWNHRKMICFKSAGRRCPADSRTITAKSTTNATRIAISLNSTSHLISPASGGSSYHARLLTHTTKPGGGRSHWARARYSSFEVIFQWGDLRPPVPL